MHQIDFGELLMIKITREKFLEKVIKLHGLKYDYTFVDYVNNTTKIKIICQIHGMFLQRPVNHLKGKGCDKCGGTSDLTAEKFKEKCIKIHNKKYDYLLTEYKSYNSKIIIICPDHGIFFQTPRNHLQGRGCPKCGKTNVISTQEFIEKASKVHKEKYDYCLSNYINAKTKVKIICRTHGEFKQIPSDHFNGRGCSKCKYRISKKETAWLDSLNVLKEYRQISLIMSSGKRYEVDAFDPINNTVYEFNGDYWHGNPMKFDGDTWNQRTNCTFGELYQKTLSKKQELILNNYNVISIWENDFKKTISLSKKNSLKPLAD